MIFPLYQAEHDMGDALRAIIYAWVLIYLFSGVNIVADKFMSSIEMITSKKMRMRVKNTNRMITVKLWNDTVANLTLMALGSSAPEILLSIVEIIRNGFYAGELGPSTIVGSAAFNLFMIIAVCIMAIPSPETRHIKETGVFKITAVFSLLAYFWMVVIVQVTSPGVIQIWEGVVTLAWLPVLIVISWLSDIGWFSSHRKAGKHISNYSSAELESFNDRSDGVGPSIEGPDQVMNAEGKVIRNPAGILTFESDQMEVMGGHDRRQIVVPVLRKNGCRGCVKCKYRTEALTATPGYDYVEDSGLLSFEAGASFGAVEVTLLPKQLGERSDEFQLILDEPEGGVLFNPNDDGGSTSCVLTVKIVNENALVRGFSARVLGLADQTFNLDSIRLGTSNWKDEIAESMKIDSGDDGEEPGAVDWLVHFVTFPWKFLFALICPPAIFAGGWLLFVLSLLYIGGLTAVIIDFAELFGCVANVKDSITAITFVALGTSMPDLFASKMAAVQDEFADASIVNVTGSNSVNVFLGIGIPWTIAAIYWALNEPTDKWRRLYGSHLHEYPHGAFVVEGGEELTFGVVVFSIAALVAISVIRLRRLKLGGELGGPYPMKVISATLLVMMWIFYILLSIWKVQSPEADINRQVAVILTMMYIVATIVFVVGCLSKAAEFLLPSKKYRDLDGAQPVHSHDGQEEEEEPPFSPPPAAWVAAEEDVDVVGEERQGEDDEDGLVGLSSTRPVAGSCCVPTSNGGNTSSGGSAVAAALAAGVAIQSMIREQVDSVRGHHDHNGHKGPAAWAGGGVEDARQAVRFPDPQERSAYERVEGGLCPRLLSHASEAETQDHVHPNSALQVFTAQAEAAVIGKSATAHDEAGAHQMHMLGTEASLAVVAESYPTSAHLAPHARGDTFVHSCQQVVPPDQSPLLPFASCVSQIEPIDAAAHETVQSQAPAPMPEAPPTVTIPWTRPPAPAPAPLTVAGAAAPEGGDDNAALPSAADGGGGGGDLPVLGQPVTLGPCGEGTMVGTAEERSSEAAFPPREVSEAEAGAAAAAPAVAVESNSALRYAQRRMEGLGLGGTPPRVSEDLTSIDVVERSPQHGAREPDHQYALRRMGNFGLDPEHPTDGAEDCQYALRRMDNFGLDPVKSEDAAQAAVEGCGAAARNLAGRLPASLGGFAAAETMPRLPPALAPGGVAAAGGGGGGTSIPGDWV